MLTLSRHPKPAEPEAYPEESSSRSDIDTLEFRPSDAQDGEFDTNPL